MQQPRDASAFRNRERLLGFVCLVFSMLPPAGSGAVQYRVQGSKPTQPQYLWFNSLFNRYEKYIEFTKIEIGFFNFISVICVKICISILEFAFTSMKMYSGYIEY